MTDSALTNIDWTTFMDDDGIARLPNDLLRELVAERDRCQKALEALWGVVYAKARADLP